MKSYKPKRKPYIPPPDFRNVERGKALLERLIRESEQKDKEKQESHETN